MIDEQKEKGLFYDKFRHIQVVKNEESGNSYDTLADYWLSRMKEAVEARDKYWQDQEMGVASDCAEHERLAVEAKVKEIREEVMSIPCHRVDTRFWPDDEPKYSDAIQVDHILSLPSLTLNEEKK